MAYTVLRADDRPVTTTTWLTSRHSFSFGDHYDPANTHHGVLLTQNDEVLAAGEGFDSHHHQETEIVTWVVAGALEHHDSAGHTGVVVPGLAQRMTAGSGVEHAERASADGPTRYVQMWLSPDTYGLAPSYEQCDVSAQLAGGGLITVASGDPARPGAVSIANRGAVLHAARLADGGAVQVPAARFTHLYVVDGSVAVSTTESVELIALQSGDAYRESRSDIYREGSLEVVAVGAAEILVWSMTSALGESFS